MPHNKRTANRRAVLASTPAGGAAAAPQGAGAKVIESPDPASGPASALEDAQLFRLLRRWRELGLRYKELVVQQVAMDAHPPELAVIESAIKKIVPKVLKVRRQVATAVAETSAGALAKIEITAELFIDLEGEIELRLADSVDEDTILLSALRDLARLGTPLSSLVRTPAAATSGGS